MPHHTLKLYEYDIRSLESGRRNSLLIHDNDFQTGDTVRIVNTDNRKIYRADRTITHLLKNIRGIEQGYVVLSFNDPEKDFLQERKADLFERLQAAIRSQAALRGQITKLRKRLETA